METNRAFKRKWYDTLIVLYVQTVLLFLVGQIAGSLLVGLLGSGLLRLSESFAASDAWVMAHTVWNYTQNIIFGLPNSGIEGTVVADVMLILAMVAIYAWGRSRRTNV